MQKFELCHIICIFVYSLPYFVKNSLIHSLYLFCKAITDRILALGLLLLSLPALLCIVVILFAWNKQKVFFKQVRIGQHSRLFWVYKFRTMNEAKDAQGNLLSDALRITRIGLFLRKTSLDELPQLWNILRGDMSFVGPRPLLPEYLPLYNKQQASRHSVPQGLTGWAQIHGRNALDWQARLELDAYYAHNASLRLDIYILLKTAYLMITKHDGDILAEKFNGNAKKVL